MSRTIELSFAFKNKMLHTILTYGGESKSSNSASGGAIDDLCSGACTICTGSRSFMCLPEDRLYFGPSAICNSRTYLLATNVEKNEGSREKQTGRMMGIDTDVSHSKRVVVVPASSNCQ
jgi:hypothetical protein